MAYYVNRDNELLPFAVETCGGLAPAAVKLIQAMAQAAAQHFWLEAVSKLVFSEHSGKKLAFPSG